MSEKHWLRPLSGRTGPSVHVMPWIATDLDESDPTAPPRRLTAGQVRLWVITVDTGPLQLGDIAWDGTGEQLADRLAGAQMAGVGVYLWLPRGWADMVLSGFAALVDAGRYVWRFASLEGARIYMVGQLDGRALTVTSLANWTGKSACEWDGVADRQPVAPVLDAWMGKQESLTPWRSKAERTALGSLLAILDCQHTLLLGRPAATAASAGRRMWRAWLGPRILAAPEARRRKQHGKKAALEAYVAPLCSRPDAVRQAERHVVYPLPHEHYGSGRVEGPVTLFDLRNAYWSALSCVPIPINYCGTVRTPTIPELASGLAVSGGLALVRIDSPTKPYPLRWHGRSARALGRFWTWLCGLELGDAVNSGHVKECDTWHRWGAVPNPDDRTQAMAAAAHNITSPELAALAKPWRAMYSALIGGFARWNRTWKDVDHPHTMGRWSTWTARDAKTGGIVHYRCIGGRTQRLTSLDDPPSAVPLLYGCVTALLRLSLDDLAQAIGYKRLLAITADTLWVRGAPELLDTLSGDMAPLAKASLRVAAVYDRVWLDGQGRAAVQAGDKRMMHAAGIPLEPCADAEGRVVWTAQGEWTCGELARLKNGVPIVRKSYDVSRIIGDNDYPFRRESPWLALQDGVFREELHLPVLHPQVAGPATEDL